MSNAYLAYSRCCVNANIPSQTHVAWPVVKHVNTFPRSGFQSAKEGEGSKVTPGTPPYGSAVSPQ